MRAEHPIKSKVKGVESNKLHKSAKCWFKLLIFKCNAEKYGLTTGNNSFNSSIVKIPWPLKDCKFKSGSFSFRVICIQFITNNTYKQYWKSNHFYIEHHQYTSYRGQNGASFPPHTLVSWFPLTSPFFVGPPRLNRQIFSHHSLDFSYSGLPEDDPWPTYNGSLFKYRHTPYRLRGEGLNLELPNFNLKFKKNSFTYSLTKLWNSLPSQVRLSSDANDFRSKLHDCSFLERVL